MSTKLQIAQRFFDLVTKTRGFDKCIERVKLLSCDGGKCSCEFKVGKDELNKFGTMHGGFTATLADVVTSALLVAENPDNAGVSVNLNVNYLRAAPLGAELIFDASLSKLGKQLAFMDFAIKEKHTGKLIATATHTKFLTGIASLPK